MKLDKFARVSFELYGGTSKEKNYHWQFHTFCTWLPHSSFDFPNKVWICHIALSQYYKQNWHFQLLILALFTWLPAQYIAKLPQWSVEIWKVVQICQLKKKSRPILKGLDFKNVLFFFIHVWNTPKRIWIREKVQVWKWCKSAGLTFLGCWPHQQRRLIIYSHLT